MSTRVQRVVLVAFENRPDALELARDVAQSLTEKVETSLRVLPVDRQATVDPATLVVSLGGDGTFLRAARLAHTGDARVLGVNLGRVGFLLSVPPESLHDEIARVLDGDYEVEERVALRVRSTDAGIDEFALNEVVLERSQPGHMVRVRTVIDGGEFLTYSADGVLVATATGSTAYNFSAGGPVLSPELDALVITPIAPHFTIDRSIVVGASQPIRLEVLDRPAAVVADGAQIGQLAVGQCIDVARDPRSVKVIVAESVTLGARLRASLREGHAG